MKDIMRLGPFTYYKYGGIRREFGFWGRVMLVIEHREPRNRRMYGAHEWWNCYPAGYLKYRMWYGWLWIHSYCITIEWAVRSAHIDAKLGSLFR